ncbi:MAG TPA: hypothetical protein VN721_02250 [Flavipsychrobacter sp.]|nr:hypothetical protein [Flavipsychrobacter sp.]
MPFIPIHIDNNIQGAVLYILRYYDVFRYPLKREEIHNNCPILCHINSIDKALSLLEADMAVYKYKDYYSIAPDIKQLVRRREKANDLAKEHIKSAIRVGKFIYSFPFVRFVSISGSLSKGYADANTDYDFFIVTKHNRLWICRTLLHLFKKLTFLVGKQHQFCMNYFIDSEHLEIEEKNIYTAIELHSIIPISGVSVYSGIIRQNKWLSQYIPNGYLRLYPKTRAEKKDGFIKKCLEFLLDHLSPSKLNEWLMHKTDIRWRKKWFSKNYPEEDYSLAFKTTLYHSKNHPHNYQKKVLNILENHVDKKHH